MEEKKDTFYTAWKNEIGDRHSKNLELLERLKEAIDKYPDQRFGQIIRNYFMEDENTGKFFYQEPKEIIDYFDRNFN